MPSRPTPPGLRAAALAAIALVAGAAARLLAWPRVFTPGGVRLLGDSDPHYHLLQAARILSGGLASSWRDPALDWPHGARVPWPPLFDLLLARATTLWAGAAPSRLELERVGAVVPVVLGVLTLPLVAGLARTLGPRGAAGLRAWAAALIVALLPGHVSLSTVGRPDQHVAEVLLASAAMLGFVGAWSAERLAVRRASVAALGLAVALAFWTWLGSALVLVVPVAFVGLAHVVLPDDHPAGSRIPAALAGGLGLGAAVLAASLAVWGAPGALARGDLLGLTGLQVAVTALAAGFGAVLWGARRLRARPSGPVRRLLEALGASAAALALLAAPSSLREGLRQGLTALGAANPWYADISEFQHLLLSCQAPLAADASSLVQLYGLTLPAALLAIPPLCRRWADPAERPRVLLLATWGGVYLVLALLRRRFAPYAVIPMALLSVEAVAWAAGRFAARAGSGRRSAVQAALGAAGVALVLAPALPALSSVGETPAGWIDAMRWLGEQPVRPGREAALTQWPLGHLALYYAGKPVLATPFGTEGGAGAMPAVARFALSPRPVDAEALLADRQVGWVVLADPVVDAWVDQAMVGEGGPVLVHRSCTIAGGKVDELEASFLGLEAPRLYYFDGNAPPGAAAAPIDGLRLVYESRPIPAAPEAPSEQAKVFAAVTGARLEVTGAAPGRPVTATVRLLTNQGRETGWRTIALPDEAGVAHLRLPYATGPNGAIQASPWTVEDGVSGVALETREDDVSLGRTLGVALRGPDDIRR